MKIALDYDKTYTLNKPFWNKFAIDARENGFDIRIITIRNPLKDNIDDRVADGLPIIYTDGVAKKWYCYHNAYNTEGWNPDVWIDDRPETIINNSGATREQLAEWRASPDHDA